MYVHNVPISVYSLIQRWHTALVAHELVAKDEMNAKEHCYGVIAIVYGCFQIFLKKIFILISKLLTQSTDTYI